MKYIMSNFRVLKIPLKSVIRDPDKTIPPLLDYIQNINTIVSLGYSLIRLYILHCFHNKSQLPDLSKEFCGNALSVIMFPKRKRSKPLIARLQTFYQQQFSPLLPAKLTIQSKNLSSIAQSLSEEMATALHNNITVHFVSRLKTQIIQLIIQQKEFSELTKPQVRQGASKVINALWERNITDLPASLHNVYQLVLLSYLPQRVPEKNLGWDLEANFLDYLLPTLLLNQARETQGQRLFQPVSLRSSMVPKYMTIDTNAVIR